MDLPQTSLLDWRPSWEFGRAFTASASMASHHWRTSCDSMAPPRNASWLICRASAHMICEGDHFGLQAYLSMDGFMPIELKHLALWSPSHIVCLTQLLQKVETSGSWPRVTTVGAVAFVAKSDLSALCNTIVRCERF